MHCFTNSVVTTERKRNITHATADTCIRKIFLNPFCSSEKIDCILAVFFHSGSYWKNIWIENNIFRWKTDLINQNIIRSFADFNSPFIIIGLTYFVKSHHDYRGAIFFNQFCLTDEVFFAFFQADRIDHAFSLSDFQTCFNNFPFGTVNHHRNSRNIGFRSN